MKEGIKDFLVRYGMRFYRNGEGNPRSEGGASTALIDRFLMEDIQDSPNSCREIHGVIEKILSGEILSWKRVGNAHVLLLSADEVKVESLVSSAEKPCRLPLEDFREILRNWLRFLEGKPGYEERNEYD